MLGSQPGSRGIAQAWPAVLVLALGVLVGSSARATPQRRAQAMTAGHELPPPPPEPMPGMFAFEGALSDVSGKVVKNAPFSAVVVSETLEDLADGNRIDRKSEGAFARDSQGRTRREMTLKNIGPWAASGEPPQLVFINDPVTGGAFLLNQSRKVAYRMPLFRANTRLVISRMRRAAALRGAGPGMASLPRARALRKEIVTQSLGQKRFNGLLANGTRTIRTIPAGQIGNEKPIVITTDRWYSLALHTTVLVRRSDPRFGTSTFELTHIRLSPPAPSLFVVPVGFRVERAGRIFMRPNAITVLPGLGRKRH